VFRSIRRDFACALALSVAALTAQVGVARGDTVTPLGTLQHLIDLGQTGITVGNLHYSNFSYIGSPVPSAMGGTVPNPAPTAAAIVVGAINGADPGLSFVTIWESAEGFNQDSVIRFDLHVLNGAVSRVGLDFNGSDPVPGLLTNASVTESVGTSPDHTIGQTTVFNDGTGHAYNRLNSSLDLTNPLRDLFITKDIAVHTPVGLGGVATISVVDQRYHVIAVPVPASTCGGLGLMGLLLCRSVVRARRSIS
jgi:hypothetical protein